MGNRLAKFAAALAFLALVSPCAALALTYSPPSYDFTADPGDVISDNLKVQNESNDTVVIKASALNFMGKPGDETSGVPEFYPADEVRDGRGLAPWLSFVSKDVTLKPGERGTVYFQITVPKDADPGSHFGAVVLTTESPGVAAGVGVIGNSVSLILLKVTGNATEDMKLTSFSAKPKSSDSLPIVFEARLENGGNVHERPYGQVTIRNLFGRTVAILPMNRADNKSVLPGGARRFDTTWNGRNRPANASKLAREWRDFKLGPYTAEVSLEWGAQKKTLTAKTTVWLFPWMALLTGLAGLAALALGLKHFFAWYTKRIISRIDSPKV